MANNIIVESEYKLTSETLDSIKSLIGKRLDLDDISIENMVNPKLTGGIIVSINDKKFIISNVDVESENSQNVNIISRSPLTDSQKLKFKGIAAKKFNVKNDVGVTFSVSGEISAGVILRYLNQEVDMTLDSLIDKAFSKI